MPHVSTDKRPDPIAGIMEVTRNAESEMRDRDRVLGRTLVIGRAYLASAVLIVLLAVALALLSTMTPETSLVVTGGYLFLLGAGIGCALQLLVLIVQNALPDEQVGTATAANNFFREIGVSVGSALVGAAFTLRLTTLLDAGQPPASAYHDALTPVFGYLVPLMLVSAVALVFVRPVPLATTAPDA